MNTALVPIILLGSGVALSAAGLIAAFAMGSAAPVNVLVAEPYRDIIGQLRHLKALQIPKPAMLRDQRLGGMDALTPWWSPALTFGPDIMSMPSILFHHATLPETSPRLMSKDWRGRLSDCPFIGKSLRSSETRCFSIAIKASASGWVRFKSDIMPPLRWLGSSCPCAPDM